MYRWLLPIFVSLVIAAGSIWYAERTVARGMAEQTREAESKAEARMLSLIQERERNADSLGAIFTTIDDLKTAQEQALRRLRNADHLAAARRLGISSPGDSAAILRLAAEGKLHQLEDNRYYWIQDLDVSVPFVTPDLAGALEEMGRRFQDSLATRGLPAYRFNISSVLRTREGQRTLRSINPNATRGMSAHEYGTTLDVVYHTYDLSPEYVADTRYERPELERGLDRLLLHGLGMVYWQEMQGVFGRILIAMQQEGKVLVTLEREQPVFHITVSTRY